MRHDSEGVLTMASSGKPEESASPVFHAYRPSKSTHGISNYNHCALGRGVVTDRFVRHSNLDAGSAKGCQFYICTERAPQALPTAHTSLRDMLHRLS